MGTAQATFEGNRGGSDNCAWPEVTSVTWPEEALFGSMFCACTTGSCAISALVGPFSPEVTNSRDRKRPCPAFLYSRTFFSVLFVSRTFFLVLFSVVFSPYFLFWVLFFSYFFFVLFPVLFFSELFSPVLFFRTIFPYFFKSRDVWNPTFYNISEFFFLVHVVILRI